jgi:hypothetical protein
MTLGALHALEKELKQNIASKTARSVGRPGADRQGGGGDGRHLVAQAPGGHNPRGIPTCIPPLGSRRSLRPGRVGSESIPYSKSTN